MIPEITSEGRVYEVASINGRAPEASARRGSDTAIIVFPTALSLALGCRTIVIDGEYEDGRFVAGPQRLDDLVVSPGTCTQPVSEQLETVIYNAIVDGTGEVEISESDIVVVTPGYRIVATR